MALQIGIDLGTSGCRAIAINQRRQVVGEARTALPPSHTPAPGHFEQNPEEWWRATLLVLDQLITSLSDSSIASITVDGTSSTLLLCDEKGEPLTPGLMYNDSRATLAAEQIGAVATADSGALGSNSAASKLLHLSQQLEIKNKKIYSLHQADWISNRLCNQWGESDENNCLKLGYDPANRQWPTWLSTLNLPSAIQLPQVGIPGSPYGQLDTALQQQWGLENHPPIALCRGTTDSIASTLAAGISETGDAVTTLGTTLVLKILSDTPIFSPQHGVYSHRLGDRWLVSGASNAGAGVLLQHFTMEEIHSLSQQIDPIRPTQLNYYPLPSIGERFPFADPTLPPHISPIPEDRTQFLQGLLEGLSQIEHLGYQKMVELGAPAPKRILTVGGGAKNRTWMALRQQHLQAPITVAPQTEAAYGAALLPLLKLWKN